MTPSRAKLNAILKERRKVMETRASTGPSQDLRTPSPRKRADTLFSRPPPAALSTALPPSPITSTWHDLRSQTHSRRPLHTSSKATTILDSHDPASSLRQQSYTVVSRLPAEALSTGLPPSPITSTSSETNPITRPRRPLNTSTSLPFLRDAKTSGMRIGLGRPGARGGVYLGRAKEGELFVPPVWTSGTQKENGEERQFPSIPLARSRVPVSEMGSGSPRPIRHASGSRGVPLPSLSTTGSSENARPRNSGERTTTTLQLKHDAALPSPNRASHDPR